MSEAIIEIARIPMLQRHSLYPAVEVIGPAVVAAGEFGGIAAPGRDHERAAMGALIVDDADRASGIVNQHDGPAADRGGGIVTRDFSPGFHARYKSRSCRRSVQAQARKWPDRLFDRQEDAMPVCAGSIRNGFELERGGSRA